MKQTHKKIAVLILLFFGLQSCATTAYIPKGPHISAVTKGYQRDGHLFRYGFINKGLVEAVEPNPEALQYAKKGRKNAKWTFGLLSGGLVGIFAPVYAGDKNKPSGDTRNVVSYSLFGVGLALMTAAFYPALKADASFKDAINKYNDDVFTKIQTTKGGE